MIQVFPDLFFSCKPREIACVTLQLHVWNFESDELAIGAINGLIDRAHPTSLDEFRDLKPFVQTVANSNVVTHGESRYGIAR